jgi:hypothetical protein
VYVHFALLTSLVWLGSDLAELESSNSLTFYETVRLSAYRLIEAGSPPKPGIEGACASPSHLVAHLTRPSEGLIHLLRLASKTGATLAGVFWFSFLAIYLSRSHFVQTEIGKADLASTLLTSAAEVRLNTRQNMSHPEYPTCGVSTKSHSERQKTRSVRINSLWHKQRCCTTVVGWKR